MGRGKDVAQQKRANATKPQNDGDTSSSSSEDDNEDDEDKMELEGKGKAKAKAKGKGKAVDVHDDMQEEEGSQGINALGEVDLGQFLQDTDIPAHVPTNIPAKAGDSKEERIIFLRGLSKEARYQDMVQWLQDNLVIDSALESLAYWLTSDPESRRIHGHHFASVPMAKCRQ